MATVYRRMSKMECKNGSSVYVNSTINILPLGWDAGPESSDPPVPGLWQSGGANPVLQWQCPKELQTPLPLQLLRHFASTMRDPTGRHRCPTHICKMATMKYRGIIILCTAGYYLRHLSTGELSQANSILLC